jgi:hypothetical protein
LYWLNNGDWPFSLQRNNHFYSYEIKTTPKNPKIQDMYTHLSVEGPFVACPVVAEFSVAELLN